MANQHFSNSTKFKGQRRKRNVRKGLRAVATVFLSVTICFVALALLTGSLLTPFKKNINEDNLITPEILLESRETNVQPTYHP